MKIIGIEIPGDIQVKRDGSTLHFRKGGVHCAFVFPNGNGSEWELGFQVCSPRKAYPTKREAILAALASIARVSKIKAQA